MLPQTPVHIPIQARGRAQSVWNYQTKMDYLAIYLMVAAVLAHKCNCRPEWNIHQHYGSPDHYQYISHHGAQAIPVIRHDGFLVDTPEVTLARHAHLEAHNHNDDHLTVHTPHNTHENSEHLQGQENIKPYHGPIAVPVVLPSGHLADTPEVAVAKSHHLAAVAQANADKYYSGHAEYGYGGAYGYSGSHQGYGVPVVLPNGHIADTHEVAMVKSAHLLAVAHAKADKYYSGHKDYNYGGAYGYSGSYHGYSIPVVLPSGHLADTHEVAAAKAAHMTAVAHAKAEQTDSHYHHLDNNHDEYTTGEPHYNTYISHDPHYEEHYVPQHGLQSYLVVAPGYFADAHEVSTFNYHPLNQIAQSQLASSHQQLY